MTNTGTKFTPETKKTGDRLRSADWNAAMQEIVRLETPKLNREGRVSDRGCVSPIKSRSHRSQIL